MEPINGFFDRNQQDTTLNISREQIRAARALLDWSQKDLADEAGLSKTAIANVENGKHRPTTKNASSIVQAFTRHDIEFVEDGVRKRKDFVKIFDGSTSFDDFFDDVYLEIKKYGGEILINGIDENTFKKHFSPGFRDKHIQRMESLGNYTCRCLIKQDDPNPEKVDYAEYKRVSESLYSNVPFYIYGKKLAIILWKDNPKIIVLDDTDVRDAYRKQFNYVWENE